MNKEKISDFTIEELEEQLKLLKKQKERKPKLIVDPDIHKLGNICEEYIDTVGTEDFDDDLEHYIFEEAMETFYGKSIWDYINNNE